MGAMKVFIPFHEDHLHLLEDGDRLVPYQVDYTLFSRVGNENFTDADGALTDQSEESAHPRAEPPTDLPGPR